MWEWGIGWWSLWGVFMVLLFIGLIALIIWVILGSKKKENSQEI